MPLLTPEQCREQCRVDGDYDDAMLLALLAAAEDSAAAYLNRAVFADAAALEAAQDALAETLAGAQSSYDAAIEAADAETDSTKAQAMRDVAQAKLDAVKQGAARTLAGIVANGSVLAAIRLTLGHLYANRESVVVESATAQELPLSVTALLRPYRQVQMP